MKWLRNILVGLIAAMGLAIVAGVFWLIVLLFPPSAQAGTFYTEATFFLGNALAFVPGWRVD